MYVKIPTDLRQSQKEGNKKVICRFLMVFFMHRLLDEIELGFVCIQKNVIIHELGIYTSNTL